MIEITQERPEFSRDQFTSVDIVEERVRNSVALGVGLSPQDKERLSRYAGSVAYLMEMARMCYDPDTFLEAALNLGKEHAGLLEKVGAAKVETARSFALAVIESRSYARRQTAGS